jgi:DNA-binding transcriptional MocR family regulator
MTIWQPSLQDRSGPAYLALADAIAEAVAAQRLLPGDRLPAQRDLAYRLGLSLSTVTRGYSEAVRRGLLEGTVGRGTFVRRPGSKHREAWSATLARPADGPIDFASNLPFPGRAATMLARMLADLSASPELGAFLSHAPDDASRHHAEAGARWIATLGGDRQGGGDRPGGGHRQGRSVIVINGAQQGLFVAFMALTRPGDAILVEELTYPPVLAIARHLGLTVFPVAMDEEGMRPDSLEAQARSTGARLVHTMPTLQTPTATTMSGARREEVARIVRQHGLTVVEDDVFGFLPRDRPAPLAAYASECTVFVTSGSKSLAPGLRIGFLQAPDAMVADLRSAVALSSWMPPPLMAEIVARWIGDGTAGKLNDDQRVEAGHRQNIARRLLDGHAMRSDRSGFHIWLTLPDGWSSDTFEAAARREGVLLRGAAIFAVEHRAAPEAARLCLSHEVDRDRVVQGLERIAALLRRRPDAGAFVV